MEKPLISMVNNRPVGWHTDQFFEAAKLNGINLNIIDLKVGSESLIDQLGKAGDVIIWRSSSLDHSSERSSLVGQLDKKVFINESIFLYPFAAHKFFQQNMLASSNLTNRYAVKTFRAKSPDHIMNYLENGSLKYPLIAKPNKGSCGRGIEIIKNSSELDELVARVNLRKYVFQNFIKNSGDWRVIVVGGRALGSIKRVAKEGSFLNNISQGASATVEKDKAVLKKVFYIALSAASVFKLRFCGVDIMLDQETGQYRILEINTAPQWDNALGFQSLTGVNVASEVLLYAKSMADRTDLKSISGKVMENYQRNLEGSSKFHFSSRLWLWTGNEEARDSLDSLKGNFIGLDENNIMSRLLSIVSKSKKINQAKYKPGSRKYYFKKYSNLKRYNRLLAKSLFSKSIYGIDIRPNVKEMVSDQQFMSLLKKLSRDEDAIRVIPTHSINYFYFLKHYFDDNPTALALLPRPHELLKLFSHYNDLIDRGVTTKEKAAVLKVYGLCHAVIGESGFYQNVVDEQIYHKMVKKMEKVILQDYQHVTLDCQLEYLIACKLTGYKTPIKKLIINNAKASLSWAGNFIDDKSQNHLQSLAQAEHRSVLFLMAVKRFKKENRSASLPEQLIGRTSKINFPDFGIVNQPVKVDTGARHGSMHVEGMREIKRGPKTFLVFHPISPKNPEVSVEKYKRTVVKSSFGAAEERYMIDVLVTRGKRSIVTPFTLTDRGTQRSPVLLGRKFLKDGNYIVNVGRKAKL